MRTSSVLSKQSEYALSEWLDTFDWTHWATLTTNYQLTLKSARRIATGFYKELSRAGDTKIFWAAEPFDLKESYHLHALIKIPDVLSYKNIIQTYQHVSGNKGLKKSIMGCNGGEKVYDSNNRLIKQNILVNGNVISQGKNPWNRIELESYKPKLGATHYISKYITKELSDYDFIVNSNSQKF